MEGPLRGCLAGFAAWKLGWRVLEHDRDFRDRVLVIRLREVLKRNLVTV